MNSTLFDILRFAFSCWNQVILLYFGGGILSYVFAVWIVKKVARLFDYIVH